MYKYGSDIEFPTRKAHRYERKLSISEAEVH